MTWKRSLKERETRNILTLAAAYLHGEDVVLDPGPLVDHVLDGDPALGQRLGQLGDPARPVCYRDRELDQAAVGGQAPLQAAAQHRGVDVATAQGDHHPGKKIKNRKYAPIFRHYPCARPDRLFLNLRASKSVDWRIFVIVKERRVTDF